MTRDKVLVLIPPNSNIVISGRLLTVTNPAEHSDWSDFLCLGVLSLVSALAPNPDLDPIYLDGTIIELDDVLNYITDNAGSILAVCIGMLTANYEAGRMIARHTKAADPRIVTIAGNDHFSSLTGPCMRAAPELDYGFAGNEIVTVFADFIGALRHGKPIDPAAYPGLVHRTAHGVQLTDPHREPVFASYDYSLVDRAFPHTSHYTEFFGHRIAPRMQELTGRAVTAGVPVEIGRGCVKFAASDACSFCSIQPGHLWRNQLTPQQAWGAISDACANGYDYLYLTADELPLTFAQLLTGMAAAPPAWWSSLSEHDRPFIVGYGRADGIADERRTALLTSLGVRQIMIGMDAGAPVSLAAMNKPLRARRGNLLAEAEKLYRQNSEAITVAHDNGLLIRAGFVVGHLGMTRELLQENLERILALITEGGRLGVFSAVDTEVLSPQPGAKDWTYLIDPDAAWSASVRLGLGIADEATRKQIAGRWAEQDVVTPEEAMRDYTTAFMPELSFDDLAQARRTIREHAKACGVVIGE
ncbi:radical SAM superfamily enzyme YgiQ (UPF0313 family) [Catenuloplanes nepalensis]|uniref:Radical SAM superfamily enzyme YgiQ (UPF0313 family) n=1 Tax=Catenuloplanes nepalensis TaxID=587533 RepID=A0ABT9MM48_9ACTN|nr:hypothetical protein [Catenuloplanes nepalensis]MDP9792495.1 radical SAM superfamily enzyme YgiQ (UPF0313 family) [Catenuloplanes nepalensis]